MIVEGELVVRVGWDGHRVQHAGVASTRPLDASRVLEGRAPAAAAAMVPLLFGICGCAQRAAAVHALSGAGARIVPAIAPTDVALETVQEYFWRLLIDWPQTMDHAIDAASVADARRRIATYIGERDARRAADDPAALRELGEILSAIAAQRIYAMSPNAWLKLDDADALKAWTDRGATIPARLLALLVETMPNLGCSDVGLMPAPARDALMRSIVPAMTAQAAFCNTPTWDGRPVETGALARMRSQPLVAALAARDGNSVATRMAARMAELAALLAELTESPADERSMASVQTVSLGRDEALAAVQTARGLLLHRVRVERGRVAQYRIVAPTEWNFHPDGALVRGLRGIAANDAASLERKTRLAVQALDPCVAFRIEVGHA